MSLNLKRDENLKKGKDRNIQSQHFSGRYLNYRGSHGGDKHVTCFGRKGSQNSSMNSWFLTHDRHDRHMSHIGIPLHGMFGSHILGGSSAMRIFDHEINV